MYKNEDSERFFLRYKAEAYPAGESIQSFCIRNNVAYNLLFNLINTETQMTACYISLKNFYFKRKN